MSERRETAALIAARCPHIRLPAFACVQCIAAALPVPTPAAPEERMGPGSAQEWEDLADPMRRLVPSLAARVGDVEDELKAWQARAGDRPGMTGLANTMADLHATVTTLVREAVAKEREACAQIAQGPGGFDLDNNQALQSRVTAAIRARAGREE